MEPVKTWNSKTENLHLKMRHRLVQRHVLQGMTGVYLVTYTFGYEMWKFTVPYVDLTAAEAFEILVYGMLHSCSFFYSRCTWHHKTFPGQTMLTLSNKVVLYDL